MFVCYKQNHKESNTLEEKSFADFLVLSLRDLQVCLHTLLFRVKNKKKQ